MSDLPLIGTDDFFDRVKAGLAGSESGGNYQAEAPNSSAAGKYQFINSTREQFAPGMSREEFLSSPDAQEQAMNGLLKSNLQYAIGQGYDVANADPAHAAGMLWAMHLKGASEGYKTAISDVNFTPDANGTTARTYFNRGAAKFAGSTPIPPADSSMFSAPGELAKAEDTTPARAPFSVADYIGNTIANTWSSTITGRAIHTESAVTDAIDKINKITQDNYTLPPISAGLDPSKPLGLGAWDGIQGEQRKAFDTLLERVKQEHPGTNLPYNSYSDVLEHVGQQQQDRDRQLAQQTDQVSWPTYLSGLVSSAVGFFGDPVNLGLMAGTGGLAASATTAMGGGLAAQATAAAGQMAAVQGVQEPILQSSNEEMGLPHGIGEAAKDTAAAALSTGALVGGLGVIGKALGGITKSIAPKFSDVMSKLFGGKGQEVANNVAAMGKDPAPVEHAADMIDSNPMGKSSEAQQKLGTQMQQVFTQLKTGDPVNVVPPGVTGIKDGVMPENFSKEFTQSLHEEGYYAADAVGSQMEALRDHVSKQGNLTPSEYIDTPPSAIRQPTQAELLTQDANKAHDTSVDTLGTPEKAVEAAKGNLRSSTTISADSAATEALLHQRTAIEEKVFKASALHDQITQMVEGRDANVDYGNHQREDVFYGRNKRHTAMLADIESLKQVYEQDHLNKTGLYPHQAEEGLPKDFQYLPSNKLAAELSSAEPVQPEIATLPLSDAVTNSVRQLNVRVPEAKAYLGDKLDMQSGLLRGIDLQLKELDALDSGFKPHYESIQAGLDSLDPHDRMMAENRANEFKQALDDNESTRQALLREQISAESSFENTRLTSDFLDQLIYKVNHINEGDSLHPLAQTEAMLNRLQAKQYGEKTRLATDVQENGRAIESTNLTDELNSASETISALKALKNCISGS